MKRKIVAILAGIVFIGVSISSAEAYYNEVSASASTIITHQGQTDPTTEGFSVMQDGNPSTVGPIANDMGLEAWSITGQQNSQFYYTSGALSPLQMADIANHGFDLTLTARVLQNTAQTYDTANPYVFAFANFDTGDRRFDVMLGINGQAETVVVLPTSYLVSGSTVQAFGSSFTLSGSDGYHTYQLAYDPITQLADLFVDNVECIQNYAGNTEYLSNWGLGWGTVFGGQGNFNSVQLATPQSTPVPAPATMLLLGTGIAGLVGSRIRRKKQ